MTRRRLLGLTTSPLPAGRQITDGPGFRMWNLLAEVARHHDVRILSLYQSLHLGEAPGPVVRDGRIEVEPISHRPGAAARRIREIAPDALFLPWSSAGFLGSSNRSIPTILDYVGPGLIEALVLEGRIPVPLVHLKLASFWYGDLFLTTTDRERYYLIGLMAASRRLSHGGFERHDGLVQVVRMTPPTEPPAGTPRERTSANQEFIVLLAGAYLPWYDYSTVVHAFNAVAREAPGGVRLKVMGGNPRMPQVERRTHDALDSIERGCKVEFLGVVPFEERVRHYREADVGLSLPSARIEDEMAARTRVLDYLWSSLPVLSEGRDEYARTILEAGGGFGYTSSPDDLARTVLRLRASPSEVRAARDRCPSILRSSFDVEREAAPVLEFLERPTVTNRRPPFASSVEMTGLWFADVLRSVGRRIA